MKFSDVDSIYAPLNVVMRCERLSRGQHDDAVNLQDTGQKRLSELSCTLHARESLTLLVAQYDLMKVVGDNGQ
jgi:hypothetical protein